MLEFQQAEIQLQIIFLYLLIMYLRNFREIFIFQNIDQKWNKSRFFTVALLISARNNINLRKISDNLQTNLCKISQDSSALLIFCKTGVESKIYLLVDLINTKIRMSSVAEGDGSTGSADLFHRYHVIKVTHITTWNSVQYSLPHLPHMLSLNMYFYFVQPFLLNK